MGGSLLGARLALGAAPLGERMVPALEAVALPVGPAVEERRIVRVQALHSAREGRIGRLDDQMNVVRHQAVSEDAPTEDIDDAQQHHEVDLAVPVVTEYRMARKS